MAKTDNLNDFLTGIADAIRIKKGTSDPINAQDFEEQILTISSGTQDKINDINSFMGGNFYDLLTENFIDQLMSGTYIIKGE